MSRYNHHQGENIPFGLNFSATVSEDITSFDDLDEVIAYLYTDRRRPAKFSTIVRDGYGLLNYIDSTHLYGVISAATSSKMAAGDLYIEIMCKKDEEGFDDVGVTGIDTGVTILPAKIKEEN